MGALSNTKSDSKNILALTEQEQKIVSENMGLVGGVIKNHVRNISGVGIFTYDDLFQIGCIGLCKAAKTGRSKKTRFSTYAYILIRNEIYMALEYAARRKHREPVMDPEVLRNISVFSDTDISGELRDIIKRAYSRSHGIIKKGIYAICLQTEGYSCKEISQKLGAPSANHVTAWMSKARKYLKKDTGINEYAEAV